MKMTEKEWDEYLQSIFDSTSKPRLFWYRDICLIIEDEGVFVIDGKEKRSPNEKEKEILDDLQNPGLVRLLTPLL